MKKLKIIYEDKYIIVVFKNSKILTIDSDNYKHNSLYYDVSEYVKSKNKNNKIFIVHRLDRETSGLVLFAKSSKVKDDMQKRWDSVVRKYYALVHGRSKDYDKITSYLKENKSFYVYTSDFGSKAITEYNTIKKNDKYSLLDIRIYTGKKNQIRVQLSDRGLPIVGDNKYGIKDNSKKMFLLAYYLKFVHPVNNNEIELSLEIPNEFNNFIK